MKSDQKVDPAISRRMRAIKSSNTSIEIIVRKHLWSLGFRYRVRSNLPGRPDIVFVSRKVAIFIDGDFWHGRNLEELLPRLKNDFWKNKIRRNIERDIEVNARLKGLGWKVVRIWESEVKGDLERSTRSLIWILDKRS